MHIHYIQYHFAFKVSTFHIEDEQFLSIRCNVILSSVYCCRTCHCLRYTLLRAYNYAYIYIYESILDADTHTHPSFKWCRKRVTRIRNGKVYIVCYQEWTNLFHIDTLCWIYVEKYELPTHIILMRIWCICGPGCQKMLYANFIVAINYIIASSRPTSCVSVKQTIRNDEKEDIHTVLFFIHALYIHYSARELLSFDSLLLLLFWFRYATSEASYSNF